MHMYACSAACRIAVREDLVGNVALFAVLCAGLNSRVPTAHSVLLSSVVGPLGLLSHELTKVSHDSQVMIDVTLIDCLKS
jgi:hypothetical protein